MTKSEVEEQRLGERVVMPANLDCSFKSWWRSVEPTDEVKSEHHTIDTVMQPMYLTQLRRQPTRSF